MSKTSELAYNWIRRQILSGELPAGTHLKEERIAEDARVSRTPVREALRRLSNEHYVNFIPNQGAFVASWADDDVDDIFELRAMLEGYSAFRAASRITPQAINELEQCASTIEELCKQPTSEDLHSTIKYNHRFHTIIIESACSDRINKMVSWLVELPMLLKTIDRYSTADVERINHHHRELIAAFKANDGRWAQSVMGSNLHAAHQIFMSFDTEMEQTTATNTKVSI